MTTTAFQADSFQNDAFQVSTTIPIPTYSYVVRVGAVPRQFSPDAPGRTVIVSGAPRGISIGPSDRTVTR